MSKRDQSLHYLECLSTSKSQSKSISINLYTFRVYDKFLEIIENGEHLVKRLNFIDILSMVWTRLIDTYEVSFELYDKILEIKNIELENGKATKSLLSIRIAQRNFSRQYQRLEIIKQINNGEIIKCRKEGEEKIYIAKIMTGNNIFAQRELQINKYIAQHPHENVASIIEYFCDNNQIILIYHYYQGGTLNQLINNYYNKLKRVEIKKMMKRILAGLNHIHSLGIIHRDIKMDNVMIEDIEDLKSIKIIDFGFSAFKSNENYLNEKCGTIGYFAPEIINGAFYDEKCDIYSLAQIFHVLLTGKPMFERSMDKQQIIRLSKLNMFTINFGKIDCPKAQNLLQIMLQKIEKRLNAKECLEHDYFKKILSLEEKLKNMGSLRLKSPFSPICVSQ